MSGRRDRTTQLLIQKDTSSSLTSQYDPTSKFQPSSEFGTISGYHNIQGMSQKVPPHSQASVSPSLLNNTSRLLYLVLNSVHLHWGTFSENLQGTALAAFLLL